MTPVAKTGLHCGACIEFELGNFTHGVTPVAKTGLHCGVEQLVEPLLELGGVTPVAKTGLHCGNVTGIAAADERWE